MTSVQEPRGLSIGQAPAGTKTPRPDASTPPEVSEVKAAVTTCLAPECQALLHKPPGTRVPQRTRAAVSPKRNSRQVRSPNASPQATELETERTACAALKAGPDPPPATSPERSFPLFHSPLLPCQGDSGLCIPQGPGARAAWPRTSGVMEPQSWLMRASWCCSVLPCMMGLRVHISAMMHPAPHRSMGGP